MLKSRVDYGARLFVSPGASGAGTISAAEPGAADTDRSQLYSLSMSQRCGGRLMREPQ